MRAARPFLVCIHDATPAFTRETEKMIAGLAPLIGRTISFGVVPDWHRKWPIDAHPHYCRLIQENSEEVLLHGYYHRRERGSGPTSLLTVGSDEMNGLDADETRRTVERGQRILVELFGKPARGFLAPAWQTGHVRRVNASSLGLQHILGYFSAESLSGRRIPLATWSWDCGRWGSLGHIGHAAGSLFHALNRGIPSLAIHPKDLERGFWPSIIGLTQQLLDAGYQPTTTAALFDEGAC